MKNQSTGPQSENQALSIVQAQFAQLSRDFDLFLSGRADVSDITPVDCSVVMESIEKLNSTVLELKNSLNSSTPAQDNLTTLSNSESTSSERRIESAIYPAFHINVDAGKVALRGIFDIATLATTPQQNGAGKLCLRTDEVGRSLAIYHIDQASESVGEWINTISLLLAHCSADISIGGRDAADWAMIGISEMLGELHRIRGVLCLPAMSVDAVQQAIALAKQNREGV